MESLQNLTGFLGLEKNNMSKFSRENCIISYLKQDSTFSLWRYCKT